MRSSSHFIIFSTLLVCFRTTLSFTIQNSGTSKELLSNTNTKLKMTFSPCDLVAHPSALPGDPSLILVTNVDLGGKEKKTEFMKACSKAIQEVTGKPEAYIGVSVTDNADVLFGGSADPCALGNLYSIGAISMENNGAIHAKVSKLLAPHGVDTSRMYINFFDMPRENVGWNGRTFAG